MAAGKVKEKVWMREEEIGSGDSRRGRRGRRRRRGRCGRRGRRRRRGRRGRRSRRLPLKVLLWLQTQYASLKEEKSLEAMNFYCSDVLLMTVCVCVLVLVLHAEPWCIRLGAPSPRGAQGSGMPILKLT